MAIPILTHPDSEKQNQNYWKTGQFPVPSVYHEAGRHVEEIINNDLGKAVNRWILGERFDQRIIELQLNLVENPYIFRDKEEVLLFLEKHSSLVLLLVLSNSRIKTWFPQAKLILELITDPEEPDEEHLTLFISTSLEVEQAMERYDEFFDEWWLKILLDLPRPLRGKLNMNLEFQ